MDTIQGLIMRLIGLNKPKSKQKPLNKPKMHTVYPDTYISRDDWFNELNVSIRHGKKPLYFET